MTKLGPCDPDPASAPLTETALVKEWEAAQAAVINDGDEVRLIEAGNAMAAALIERPNEVIIEGKRYHVADLPMTVALLESQLAAQAKRIAELDNANEMMRRIVTYGFGGGP